MRKKTNPLIIGIPIAAILLVIVLVMTQTGKEPVVEDTDSKVENVSSTNGDDGSASTDAVPTPTPAAMELSSGGEKEKEETIDLPEGISGRVLDFGTLKPIAGARITSYLFSDGVYTMSDNYPRVLGETVSDAEGLFTIDEPEAIAANETIGRRVEKEGYESVIMMFIGGSLRDDPVIATFRLHEGGSISGSVLDIRDAKPIENASVGDIVVRRDPSQTIVDHGPFPSTWTTTNTEGQFTLKGFSSEVTDNRIPAKAEGFVNTISREAETGESGVRIMMAPKEASLTGIVYFADGSPAPGVKVTLDLQPDRVVEIVDSMRESQMTHTGEDGRFSFPALRSGAYTVKAIKENAFQFGIGCQTYKDVVLLKNQDAEIELQLPAAAHVEGRFVDADSGEGIPGVLMISERPFYIENDTPPTVASDEDGRFSLDVWVDDLIPWGDSVRIAIKIPQPWLPPEDEDRFGENYTIAQDYLSFSGIRSGESAFVEVKLPKGFTVRGRLFQPDAKTPAADTTVFHGSDRVFGDVTTDANGVFEIVATPGRDLKIEAVTDEGIGAMIISNVGSSDEEIVFVLQAFGMLSGTVKLDDDTGVPDIEVAVRRDMGYDDITSVLPPEEVVFTDSEGVWTMVKVAPGGGQMELHLSPSSKYPAPEPLRFNLEPGGELTDLNFVLSEGETLRGYVYDRSGRPIPEAFVYSNVREFAANTDESGYFEIPGIPTAMSLGFLTASSRGYQEQSINNVYVQDGEVTFQLASLGAITVKVEDSEGNKLSNYRVRVGRDVAGPFGMYYESLEESVVTSRAGTYTLEELPPAKYTFEVAELGRDSNYTGRKGTLVYEYDPEQGDQTVTVTLKDGIMLNGIVVAEDGGGPVPQAPVWLLNPPLGLEQTVFRSPSFTSRYEVTADDEGRFSIGPLEAGDYELQSAIGTLTSGKVVVSLISNEQPPVILTMKNAPRVFGNVISDTGRPARRASLYFSMNTREAGGESIMVKDGTYEKILPDAGTWTIAASEDNSKNHASQIVTIGLGESKEVTFDFSSQVTLHGTIFVNDQPRYNMTGVSVMSDTGNHTYLLPEDAGAREYSAKVFPGDVRVYYSENQIQVPLDQTFTVNSGQETQRKDISLYLSDMTVHASTSEQLFQGGILSLWKSVDGKDVKILDNVNMDRDTLRFPSMPDGTYRAILTRDGVDIGTSDWTTIYFNQPVNQLTIQIEPETGAN